MKVFPLFLFFFLAYCGYPAPPRKIVPSEVPEEFHPIVYAAVDDFVANMFQQRPELRVHLAAITQFAENRVFGNAVHLERLPNNWLICNKCNSISEASRASQFLIHVCT